MPTYFMQTAAVDARGELAADWWVTCAAYDDEGQAVRAAREFAGARMMIVSAAHGRRRAKGEAVRQGVRIASLKDLLEEPPASIHQALLDLTTHDVSYAITTFLGYEAA